MEIYEELGLVQVEPFDDWRRIDMSNYQDTITKAHNRIYNSLIDKVINGAELTENELTFIILHEKQINRMSKKSPLEQILNGAKQIISVFADDNVTTEKE